MIYSEFPLSFCALSIPLRKWKSFSRVQLFVHGLYSPGNSPGQNTGVGIPFFRGSSQLRDGTQVSTLQADSSPAEPPGKPKNTGVGSLCLLFPGRSFQPRNWTGVSCIAGGFLQLHYCSLIDPGIFSLYVSLHRDCSFCFSWPSSPSSESCMSQWHVLVSFTSLYCALQNVSFSS